MSRTLFWYVFKDLLKVFGMASGALAGIMSFGGLLRPLTQKGLDGWQVALLVQYLMPAMSTYSLPIAALFATTVVYGRMSADNEVTACRASGISYLSLVLPAVILGFFVAFSSAFLLWFTVPQATMRVEQVISSNIAKLIAHEIEETHETHFATWTVFAQEAVLQKADPAHPRDQAVLLRGPMIVSYEHPPDRPKWYQRAKEFWSAREAIVYITENPIDASAVVDVRLTDGTVFPRVFSDKASATGSITSGSFGPMTVPSLVGEKPKFKDYFALNKLRADPSQGERVKQVKAAFVQEDQSNQLADRFTAELASASHSTRIVGMTNSDTYTLSVGDAAVVRKGTVTTITAATQPIRVVWADEGQVRLTAETTGVCTMEVSAQPDQTSAIVSIQMPDASITSNGTTVAAPFPERKIQVQLPPDVASYKNRSVEDYLNAAYRDAGTRARLQYELVDLIDHIESEVHARMAFVVSCLLLPLIGASLGMMFKSGNFLTAFAVSVVPAMLSTVLIVTGQHTAESTPPPQLLMHMTPPLHVGLSLIWSGNVAIAISAVVLLWRLQRR